MNNFPNTLRVLNSAILIMSFNRPDLTAKNFDMIRKVKPLKLYFAVDGPREGNLDDIKKIFLIKKIIKRVDWPCKLKTFFRKKNLGVNRAVIENLNWFFKYEEEGIILEDDCIPNIDFFYFCENLLNYYRNNKKVISITGTSIKNNNIGNYSYYFSKYSNVWGWASWRRVWKLYDPKINFWTKWKNSLDWKRSGNFFERIFWEDIFERISNNLLESWDYQFMALAFKTGGLTVIPNVNLITNEGLRGDATNTKVFNIKHYFLNNQSINKIFHPKTISADKNFDKYYFKNQFGGRLNILRLVAKKFINFFKII